MKEQGRTRVFVGQLDSRPEPSKTPYGLINYVLIALRWRRRVPGLTPPDISRFRQRGQGQRQSLHPRLINQGHPMRDPA